MTKDEALAFDLALGALKEDRAWLESDAPTEIWEKNNEAITAIKQARALDKMAENARELGLDYEPVTTLFGSLPVYDTPPVREDWGPGPHECHSLTSASVQEPVAWRYRGILHDFDPSDWAEGPVTPLYTTPPAQPAPVQEPVAFFDPQGKGFYWAKPTKITAPVTVDVEPLPLYATPPAAPVQEPDEWLTGCPECGMDSGCDCDSGAWNPPAAPVQKPVWIQPDHLQKAQRAPFLCRVEPNKRDDFVPLYTTPPAQRQWVGLTDAEVMQTMSGDWTSQFYFARAIEAKLKELNK
jgi:hypothetical protein